MLRSGLHGRDGARETVGWVVAALVLVATASGAVIGFTGSFLLPALALGVLSIWWMSRYPFALLLLLWFATAALPHGLAADVALRFDLGPIPVHPLDLLFWYVLLVWMVSWLRRGPARPWPGGPLLLPLSAIGALVGVAVLVGILRENAPWDILRDLRSAAHYLLLPIAVVELTHRERIRQALGALLAGSTVFALLCLLLAVAPDTAPLKADILTYWLGTPRIYFHNHHAFVLTLPVAATLFLQTEQRRIRLLLLAVMAVMGAAVVLSLTRSLLVTSAVATALAAGLVTARSVDPRRWRSLARLGLAGSLAALFAFFVLANSPGEDGSPRGLDALGRRFQNLSAPEHSDPSFRGRVQSYFLALEDASEAPILGLGLGTLMRIPWAKQARRPVRTEGHQPVVDSAPLTMLAKGGTLGLVIALWFSGVLLSLLVKAWLYPAEPAAGALAAGLMAGILGLLAVSMLQTMLLTSRFISIFVLACALSGWLAERSTAPAPLVAPEDLPT